MRERWPRHLKVSIMPPKFDPNEIKVVYKKNLLIRHYFYKSEKWSRPRLFPAGGITVEIIINYN